MNARKFVLSGLVCLSVCLFPVVQNGQVRTQRPAEPKPQRDPPEVERKNIEIGTAAPDWRLKTVDGEIVSLSALRGQVVVLDFWAHWCGPCRKLEPLFDQLAREYQSLPVRFFTVSIRPGEDFDPRTFLNGNKLASTFLIGDQAIDHDYGIWGLPTYFVIDPAGKISYQHVLLEVDAEALGKRLREAIDQAFPGQRNIRRSDER